MAAKLVDGTTSTCRHCSKRIRWGKEPGSYKSRWLHINRPGEEAALCIQKDLGEQESKWPRRNWASSIDWCPVRTENGYLSYICNRAVKENGLCGIHAAAERKREQRDQDWREKYEISAYIREETERIKAKLKEEYGMESNLHYDYNSHTYTGKILVNPQELIRLLDEKWESF